MFPEVALQLSFISFCFVRFKKNLCLSLQVESCLPPNAVLLIPNLEVDHEGLATTDCCDFFMCIVNTTMLFLNVLQEKRLGNLRPSPLVQPCLFSDYGACGVQPFCFKNRD